MTKEETNKYIEELLRYLSFSLFSLPRWEKAVRALVAERDELAAKCKEQQRCMNDMMEWQNKADNDLREQQRNADRDLRERLVCAIWPEIMRQWREYKDAIDPRGNARSDALVEADKMLAAMREGGHEWLTTASTSR